MPEASDAHPVRIFVAGSMTEARLAVAFLKDRGIPSRIEDALTHEAFPGIERILDRKPGIAVVVSSDAAEGAAAAIREFVRPVAKDDEDPDRDDFRDEE
jgi:hypothetical protein